MTDEPAAPRLPPVDPASAGRVPFETITPELLASLLVDGDDELAAWAIGHALASTDRVTLYDGLVRQAMELVGERWQTGRWSVADEHLASRTLLRVLERLRPETGAEHRIGPVAVLGNVAGEHHAIGLVCLAHILTEAGWLVHDLGPDVPPTDLARFVAKNDVALVALSASEHGRIASVAETVREVREAATGRVHVILGGRLARRDGIAAAVGAEWAGTSLAEAVAYIRTIAPTTPVRTD